MVSLMTPTLSENWFWPFLIYELNFSDFVSSFKLETTVCHKNIEIERSIFHSERYSKICFFFKVLFNFFENTKNAIFELKISEKK